MNNQIKEKKNLIFKNCRIFLGEPAEILENQFLVTADDLIDHFDEMRNFDEQNYHPNKFDIIDCKNLLLIPGMIDVHVHFRDPGFKFKEDIASGSASAAAGGFTSVVCQPNTNPVLDDPFVLTYLNEQIRLNSKINIRFYGAATIGSKGLQISPIQTLFSKGACGFTDDGLPIYNSKIMKNLMEYSAELGFVVAQHAEDHHLSAGGCVHAGKFAKTFHFGEIDPASEYSVIAKDLALLEDVRDARYHLEDVRDARYHVLHVSCEKSLQYIELAKQKGLNVTSEITPHHFSLTDDALFENFAQAKMNPPLRSEKDVMAMIEGMKKGLIEIIASDHAPHEPSSKEKPVSCASFGIVGLETMLGLSLELFHKNHLSLEHVLKMLTINPARLIKEDEQRGMIKKNFKADFAIIDENEVWKVDANKLKSKSKNTPFNGRILKGRTIMTVANGEIIFNLEDF